MFRTLGLNRELPRRWLRPVTALYALLALASVFFFVFAERFLGAWSSSPILLLLILPPLLFPLVPILFARTRGSVLYALAHPVLVFTAGLAFHTLGEIHTFFVLLIAWLGFIPSLLLLTRPGVLPALLLAAAAVVGTLPNQLLLSCRWYVVHRETVRVANYVEAYGRESGDYPRDLSGYEPRSERALNFIHYSHRDLRREPQGYLSYHVGTQSTSHEYVFKDGTWFYYPD